MTTGDKSTVYNTDPDSTGSPEPARTSVTVPDAALTTDGPPDQAAAAFRFSPRSISPTTTSTTAYSAPRGNGAGGANNARADQPATPATTPATTPRELDLV